MPFVFVLFLVYGAKEAGKVIYLLLPVKKELFFFLFIRNSDLVCTKKISDGWRLTSRARQSKLPFGTSMKFWSLCPVGDWSLVVLSSSLEGRKGLWDYRKLVAWIILAGCWWLSAKLADGWLLDRASNSLFPPATTSVATSALQHTYPDGERQAWYYLSLISEKKRGKKEGKWGLFITTKPQRGVQTQFSQFRKESLMQVTFNLSDARWAILCLALPANPSNSFCHHGSRALLKRRT